MALLGNFLPGFVPTDIAPTKYSTECHLAASLETLGHTVLRLQEGEVRATDVASMVAGNDLMCWTQTQGLADSGGTNEERFEMLADLKVLGIPTLGVHLDRWFGLDREHRVYEEAWFRQDLVATADGDHDAEFAAAGINHFWSPPAIYHGEAVSGTPRPMWQAPVGFVGSWKGSYHRESVHRSELIHHLHHTGRWPVAFWPQSGAIRGAALSDLYASLAIVVGDSCMVGPTNRYWSDRVPESIGRGAFLLHPYTPALAEDYIDGVHIRYWMAGDWGELDRLIAYYLEHDDERRKIVAQGQAHVRAHHTYKHRLEKVVPMALAAHEARKVAVP